jgi:hypothetical protein
MSENIKHVTDTSNIDTRNIDTRNIDTRNIDTRNIDNKYTQTLNNIVNAIDNIVIEHTSQVDTSTLTNQYSDVLWLTGC